jgi:hypothetical protein
MDIVVERGLTISGLVACLEPVVQDSNRGESGSEDDDFYQPTVAEETDTDEGETCTEPKVKKMTKKMLKHVVHGVDAGVIDTSPIKTVTKGVGKRKTEKVANLKEKPAKKSKTSRDTTEQAILPPAADPEYTESLEDIEADASAAAELDRNNHLFYERREKVMFLDPTTIERPPTGIAQRDFDPLWAKELEGILKKSYKPDMLHVIVAVDIDVSDRSTVTIQDVENAPYRYAIGGQHSVEATKMLKKAGILGRRMDFKTIPCLVVINATKAQLLDIAIRHNKATSTIKKTGVCDMMRYYRDVLLNPESHGQTAATAGAYAVCTWHCIDPKMDNVSYYMCFT